MKNHSLIHYFGFNEWYIMHEGAHCIVAPHGFQKRMSMANTNVLA